MLIAIHKDIDRKFDSIIHINIQNFSINGIAIYNNEKCFFKIVDEEYFIKEINGYLISYKKIPTMEIMFTKRLFNSKKYLVAYTFDDNIKKSAGLLNDVLVENDLKNNISQFAKKKIKKILSMYNDIYSSPKEYYSYCPSNIFFVDRIYTRLQKWYINSKRIKKTVIYYNNEKFLLSEILNETFMYFKDNIRTKKQCVLTQGDPNTLNISTKPCLFDLATAGYNPIMGELAITIVSTLIYDNYFCPKYHPQSYFFHENAIEQYQYFEPKLIYKKSKNTINIQSNIVTSNIRKKYILDYLKMLEDNNISINEEIKYYILMRLLCVFDVKKMESIDYYYSLFMVCYFYKNIDNDFYNSIRRIVNEMECA